MKIILSIILFFNGYLLLAQNLAYRYPSYLNEMIVIQGDTIPFGTFPIFEISEKRTFKDKLSRRKYDRLKRNVMKVYPYAKLAGKMLNKYEHQLALMDSDVEKKRLMKKVEQELEQEFGDELSSLTISQGVILIKLIDRETGSTSYEVVQELRGKFSAFFWQGLARIFGHNLKDEYDYEGEERQIESIMAMIESGKLPYYSRVKKGSLITDN